MLKKDFWKKQIGNRFDNPTVFENDMDRNSCNSNWHFCSINKFLKIRNIYVDTYKCGLLPTLQKEF